MINNYVTPQLTYSNMAKGSTNRVPELTKNIWENETNNIMLELGNTIVKLKLEN